MFRISIGFPPSRWRTCEVRTPRRALWVLQDMLPRQEDKERIENAMAWINEKYNTPKAMERVDSGGSAALMLRVEYTP